MDERCDPTCYVHQNFGLNLVKRMSCKCSDKVIEQPFDSNYFNHFITASEVINGMADFKVEPDYGRARAGEFRPMLGCMPNLWKHYNSGDMAVLPYCIIDSR